MNDKLDGWRATPKTSQEPPGPRQMKVAKAGALALAAIEIYFKVYLKAVLERRRSAVALHEKLSPKALDFVPYIRMMFVGRSEDHYDQAVREAPEGMVGASFEDFCRRFDYLRVRLFTIMIDEVSDILLRNDLHTCGKKSEYLCFDYWPKNEEERTEKLRKGGYWSRYECLCPVRGVKNSRFEFL